MPEFRVFEKYLGSVFGTGHQGKRNIPLHHRGRDLSFRQISFNLIFIPPCHNGRMEDGNKNDSYEEEKRKAKSFYSTIGHVWCPALSEYIIFNKLGFRHLVGNGRKPRSKNDQKRRFFLLPLAPKVVADMGVHLEWRNAVAARIQFWALSKQQDGKFITVVLRQTGNGNKHFFSIYDKKTAG